MAAERLIGVDFGTSTSVIRVKRYENGEPIGEKLETKEVVFGGNGALVPTLIMKKDDNSGTCYYGHEAKNVRKRFTQYHGFKMDLESSDPARRAQARTLTEEFYAYLAKQYKSQSDGGHLGNPDDKERTIISYPVKWSSETKDFMLETAKKAGFPNVTGMDEAQAAIQAVIVMSTDHLQKNGLLKNGVGTNILLIDMGAGTTDLVLARYVPGNEPKTEVLNTWPKSGEITFGGKEIDRMLANFFRELLKDEDEESVEKIFRRIGEEKYKSWKEETVSPSLRKKDIVEEFTAFDEQLDNMDIDLEYCLDRTAFEDCLKDYLKQFPELVNGCLWNVGMSGSDVDLIIVTGGHSQWYFVNDMLCGKMPQFGSLDLPKIRENPARIIPITRPQETVALGLVYSGIHLNLTVDEPEDFFEPEKFVQDTEVYVAPEKEKTPVQKMNDEKFRMEFDPSYLKTETAQGTWAKGTVSEGIVRPVEKVFACGAFGSRLVEVREILNSETRRNLIRASSGDTVTILLKGISADQLRSCTHLSGIEETGSPAFTPTVAPEAPVQTSVSDSEFLFELTFFGVQWTDAFNRKTRVAGHVRGGQARVGDTVYLRKPSGEMLEASIEKIESVGLIFDLSASAANDRFKKYLLTLSGVVADDFKDVKFIQGKVAAANEYKAAWENVGDKLQSTIQTASDTVRQTAQKIEQQRLNQQAMDSNQDAMLMQTDPNTVSYAAENEFDITEQIDGCVIRKYNGTRAIVSIPPFIRGRQVVAIGERAFSGVTVMHGNKALRMVIIPESITQIGGGAFAGCSNLKIVVAHDNIQSIGASAFYGCNAVQRMDFGMGPCVDGQVTFPPALQGIGGSAFTRYAVLNTTACIFRQIHMSRFTQVSHMLSAQTFDSRYCTVHYYD